MRLFCFPFIGGSGSFFSGLEPYLWPDIELVKLEYAGHMARRHEAFYRNFDELVFDMYDQMKAGAGQEEPYALLGYSMGAIAAAEVTKLILARKEVTLPAHVFLASHGPCPILVVQEHDADTDEAVKRWTVRFGGLPEKLVNSAAFWRVYLPIYRADYELMMGYDFGRLEFETRIPATVLFSPADIPRKNVEKWRRVFVGGCDILEFEGGHFFLREHEREAADTIKERLTEHDI